MSEYIMHVLHTEKFWFDLKRQTESEDRIWLYEKLDEFLHGDEPNYQMYKNKIRGVKITMRN